MFADVCTFLIHDELPSTTTRKLLAIIENAASMRKLQMELAVTVDTMEPFVQATYDLEGDGPLVLYTYQKIKSLYAHITLRHHPNVVAVADNLAQGSAERKAQLVNYANTCYPPAYSYFKEKFDIDLKKAMDAFRSERYLLPHKIDELS